MPHLITKASSGQPRGAANRAAAWRLAATLFLVGGVSGETFAAPGLPSTIAAQEEELDWTKERQFWSFRPPTAQTRPRVRNSRWPSQPLDFFTLARIEHHGIVPAQEADRRTLIRRLTFDITGLPPAPSAIADFLQDKRQGAYERLVDRLLASPQFGERMASLWLPLARYAEDQAHQVGDDTKLFYPNAWRYRDWVIRAFNRNLPYDQFVSLQLAADRLPNVPPEDLAALGFVGLGPKYYNRNRLEVQADEWEDRVDIVGRGLLGLTVACARCHDHKFEPITMSDYYALAGIFASTKMVNHVPGETPEPATAINAEPAATEKKKEKDTIPPSALHIVEDDKPQDLNLFFRGNVERKGPVVERRFLRVLSAGPVETFKEGSGRRELARVIASADNPLTARVFVNRIWGQFFGKPLVETPSNFGHSGLAPSHPELLDDLAVRFMRNGWSVKSLVREIALSSTYRLSSTAEPAQLALDPANQWLGHMNRRRLSIEQWRDSVLQASGQLQPPGTTSLELDHPDNRRRTVYARISRLKLNDVLMQFDYPDANVHAEKRSNTTTAMQKLYVLNSPFMLGQAQELASRLQQSAGPEPWRIQNAYQLLFGREPDPAELELGLHYLRQPAAGNMPRWERYTHALLASNEMMYVD